MRKENLVSPYLQRPLRSLEEVLRERAGGRPAPQRDGEAPAADNCNLARPPARSASSRLATAARLQACEISQLFGSSAR